MCPKHIDNGLGVDRQGHGSYPQVAQGDPIEKEQDLLSTSRSPSNVQAIGKDIAKDNPADLALAKGSEVLVLSLGLITIAVKATIVIIYLYHFGMSKLELRDEAKGLLLKGCYKMAYNKYCRLIEMGS